MTRGQKVIPKMNRNFAVFGTLGASGEPWGETKGNFGGETSCHSILLHSCDVRLVSVAQEGTGEVLIGQKQPF